MAGFLTSSSAEASKGAVAAFTELDGSRIDVTAIVTFGGLATMDERRRQACRNWLVRHGYVIDTFNCRPGLSAAVPELGRLLRWEQKFGYDLGPDSRNLDALRDGFEFDIPFGGGRVFEIVRADLAWQEDPAWLCGLLSICQEQSRRQLALDRRFFSLLVVPEESPLIGAVIEQTKVPGPYWSPCREVHEFVSQQPRVWFRFGLVLDSPMTIDEFIWPDERIKKWKGR